VYTASLPEYPSASFLSVSFNDKFDQKSIAGLKPHQFIEPKAFIFTFNNQQAPMTLLFSNREINK